MRVCLPVFEKLEVARIATIIAVAHATRHVDAVLEEAMLDGGDRSGMDDALNGARESTRIVDGRCERHHLFAPDVHHELLPALNPFLMLRIGHVRLKPTLIAHNLYQ